MKNEQEVVQRVCTKILADLPNLNGQCAGASALLSKMLTEEGIKSRVCLGSLSLAGNKLFQYKKAVPKNPQYAVDWDGHAWVEVANVSIVELTLIRTARERPKGSFLRRYFESYNMLDKGALVFPKSSLGDFKYTEKSVLSTDRFDGLIQGLLLLNAVDLT